MPDMTKAIAKAIAGPAFTIALERGCKATFILSCPARLRIEQFVILLSGRLEWIY